LVKFLKEILETETLLLERKRAAEERRIRDAESGNEDIWDSDNATESTPTSSSPATEACTAKANDAFAIAQGDIELLETV
jgi:hypothetical protein